MEGNLHPKLAAVLKQRKQKKLGIFEKYDIEGKIGEGTYGVVYKATDKKTGVPIAIKKFKGTARRDEGLSLTAYREISLLKDLKHSNVLFLRETDQDKDDGGLYMVFNYADYDLFEMLRHHRNSPNVVGPRPSELAIKSIMWQLLNGLHYLHANWVMHRDIKPSNILIMGKGSEEGVVKIGDFGLARLYQSPLAPLSDNGVVVTVWYRAPELLLGAKHYTKAIDVWAVGCILGELLTAKPLFQGVENTNHKAFQESQMMEIFKVLGPPTLQQWPGMAKLHHYHHIRNYSGPPGNLLSKLRNISLNSQVYDLLLQLLTYDPAKRITAYNALQHPYFKTKPLPIQNVLEANRRGGPSVRPDYPVRILTPVNPPSTHHSGSTHPHSHLANVHAMGSIAVPHAPQPYPSSGTSSLPSHSQMSSAAGPNIHTLSYTNAVPLVQKYTNHCLQDMPLHFDSSLSIPSANSHAHILPQQSHPHSSHTHTHTHTDTLPQLPNSIAPGPNPAARPSDSAPQKRSKAAANDGPRPAKRKRSAASSRGRGSTASKKR